MKHLLPTSLLLTGLLGAASLATAQLSYTVTIDTRALLSHPAAPLSLDFQLIDGAGIGDGNTSIRLDHFQFASGNSTGIPTTLGGASGSLEAEVLLTDSDFLNEFFQEFIPGDWLSFSIHYLHTGADEAMPDRLSVAFLDSSLANLTTTAPGSDALMTFDLWSTGVGANTYEGVGNADGLAVTRLVAVPEPGTYGVAVAALLLTGCALRTSSRRSDKASA